MSIIINSRNAEVAEGLKDYISAKIGIVILEQKQPTVCEVTLIDEPSHRGGDTKEIHISCTLPNVKNPIFVSQSGDDFYKTVDLIEDKLKRALHKSKN